MKKIVTSILLILICYFTYGQYSPVSNFGGPNTLMKNPNYGGVQGGLIPFTFQDTSQANSLAPSLKLYNGAYIYTQSPQATWWRLADSSKWIMILPQGGGTPISGQAWINPGNFSLFTDAKLNGGFGTLQANGIYIKTNGENRMYLDRYGIAPQTGTTVGLGIDPSDSNRITFFSGGSGSTPTWQETLDESPILNKDNTVDGGANDFFEMVNINRILWTANSETQLTGGNSNITVNNSSISLKPYLGALIIDTLTNVAARYVLHYNPTTGLVSYADTTASSGGSLAIGQAITSATANSVLYVGTGGILQQSPTQFYYDSANVRFAIGYNAPSGSFEVWNKAQTGYFQISYPSPAPEIYSPHAMYWKVGNGERYYFGSASTIFSSYSTTDFGVTIGRSYNSTAPPNDGLIIEGNVGIGATSPSAQLHTTGTVRFANFGAGAATFDASGNISSVSDERLKNIQGQYEVGLNQVMKINPIVYKWNEKSKMEMVHDYIGFSAQNIKASLGENAVGVNKDGYMSIQDRAIMAAAINSIKELKELNDSQQKQIDDLKKEVKKLKKN